MNLKILKNYFFLSLVLILQLSINIESQEITSNKDSQVILPKTYTPKEKNSCVLCHEKLKGKLKLVVDLWGASVHAKRGNQCHICHGGNPTINSASLSKSKKFDFIGKPDKKNITDFCGRAECHSLAYFQFKKSPHYQSVLKNGTPNCTSCHGKHNIQKSSVNIITEKTCSGCHSIEYSRSIIKTVFSIENEITELEKNLQFLKAKNAEIGDIESRLWKIKHLFHEFVHIFSRKDMEFTKGIVELQIASAKDVIKSKVILIKRLDLLYILTFIFVLIVISGFSIYIFWINIKKQKA